MLKIQLPSICEHLKGTKVHVKEIARGIDIIKNKRLMRADGSRAEGEIFNMKT